LSHNPNQRWFYFPNMRRDEGRARFTPHTSFEDPGTATDAPPRQSIEVRTFAFF